MTEFYKPSFSGVTKGEGSYKRYLDNWDAIFKKAPSKIEEYNGLKAALDAVRQENARDSEAREEVLLEAMHDLYMSMSPSEQTIIETSR